MSTTRKYLVGYGTRLTVVEARNEYDARMRAFERLMAESGLMLGPEDLKARRLTAGDKRMLASAGMPGV